MAHGFTSIIFITITTITMMTGCGSGPPAQLVEKYGPPAQLVKQHDHVALAKWYEQEAAALRQRAEELRAMVGEVGDYDSKEFHEDKLTIIMHGKDLADDYSDAADTAEKLAQIHRDLQATK
ncbi:hypothetical protein [Candidatus Nitrospira allomarina]|uniref:Uncharacterized protein n=1 Tax=Candidatus Nitrospira allomarina TaxID=3020900 RepID=A0AA96G9W3_9BACT|nr:hypothetical protein [Candidatus Nitrospira allomarina]WNM57606.1 hypothetical protein PP769_16790 [Candidatus Nitrospira allomarina]